eukprot:scaffold3428_cov379-Prasinococcus_capsulatus_cf.AAC.12
MHGFDRGQAKRSMFIEDKFGQEQLAELREKGLEDAFGKYSTWLLDIFDGQPAAGHIDGRDNRLQEANYYKYKFTKADAYSQEDLEFVGEQKSPAAPEEDDARAIESSKLPDGGEMTNNDAFDYLRAPRIVPGERGVAIAIEDRKGHKAAPQACY